GIFARIRPSAHRADQNGGGDARNVQGCRIMPYCTGVYIAIPAYNKIWTSEVGISASNTRCLLQSQGIKTVLQSMGCADIANLRNLFLSHWYHFHPELSHMLMLDSD